MILRPWLRISIFVAASAAPFLPLGNTSFYGWMCEHWVDTVGGRSFGYVTAYMLCWIAIMLPLVVLEQLTLPKLAPQPHRNHDDQSPPAATPPSGSSRPQ